MWSAWRKGRGYSSSLRTSNTISIRGLEPINYAADDDDDLGDDNFGDEDGDMFSSSQWTPNTIGTRPGKEVAVDL